MQSRGFGSFPGLEALCPDDGGAPSLSLPGLADRAAEVVDASCLAFLVRRAVEDKEEEEEEREAGAEGQGARGVSCRVGAQASAQRVSVVLPSPSLHRPRGRGRRGGRGGRLGPPLALCVGRARRRQGQWHACNAGFPGDVPLLAVFLPVVHRLVMLGITAVLGQKDSYAVTLLQWHVQGPFCWYFLLVLSSLLWFAGTDARHHGRYGPEGQ